MQQRVTRAFLCIRQWFSLPVVILVAVTICAYGHSLSNGFVGDDYMNIVINDFVHSWSNFPLIFTREYLTSPHDISFLGLRPIGAGEMTYRPVVTISFFIDYFFWQLNPFGYHLTNLILHICAVLLLRWFAQIIFNNKKAALVAGLIFAVHPGQTEAVMGIAFREDVLACLFYLVSIIAYIRRDAARGLKRVMIFCASLGAYFFALFSKEMAITLPLVIIAYDYFFTVSGNMRALIRRVWRPLIGYGAVGAFCLWVWFFPMARPSGGIITYPGGSFYINILTMAKVVGTYIFWFLWPSAVRPTLPDESFIVFSLSDPQAIVSFAVIGAIMSYAYTVRRTARVRSFAIVWFFVALIPVLNIIPIQHIIASRYLYLPIAGFSLIVADIFREAVAAKKVSIFGVKSRGFFYGLFLTIVIFYTMITLSHSYIWSNELTYRKEFLRHYPNDSSAHRSVAAAYTERGEYDKAKTWYTRSKELDPRYWQNYYGLGMIYLREGNVDKAAQELRHVVAMNPAFVHAHRTYCSLLGMQKRYYDSIACYIQFLELHPDDVEGLYNLGVSYLHVGERTKAKQAWRTAKSIDPAHPVIQKNLTQLLTAEGLTLD